MTKFPNVYLINHPLIQHKLTKMRLKTTPKVEFKALLRELTLLMGYELTRDVPLVQQSIETPLATMAAPVLAQEIVIVSVLRAGLGMSDGLSVLVPDAPEGHIGLYRDPQTLQAVKYLVKLPSLESRLVLLIDPMLATGNSAVSAVDILKERGAKDQDIRFLSLVAAPEGILNFHTSHPNVPLYCAALDEKLDKNSYILPGLGDAGDRMFGTA